MSKTNFRPVEVHEPAHGGDCPNSPHNIAERALQAAEAVLGEPRLPMDRRDTHGVRALAVTVLRSVHRSRFSWSDLCEMLKGHRKHTTAITGYHRWRGRPEVGMAIELFKGDLK